MILKNQHKMNLLQVKLLRSLEVGVRSIGKLQRLLLKDPMSYVSAILLFCINTSYSSIPVYLPTILKDNGYTALKAQGLTAPPYLGELTTCSFNDKRCL